MTLKIRGLDNEADAAFTQNLIVQLEQGNASIEQTLALLRGKINADPEYVNSHSYKNSKLSFVKAVRNRESIDDKDKQYFYLCLFNKALLLEEISVVNDQGLFLDGEVLIESRMELLVTQRSQAENKIAETKKVIAPKKLKTDSRFSTSTLVEAELSITDEELLATEPSLTREKLGLVKESLRNLEVFDSVAYEALSPEEQKIVVELMKNFAASGYYTAADVLIVAKKLKQNNSQGFIAIMNSILDVISVENDGLSNANVSSNRSERRQQTVNRLLAELIKDIDKIPASQKNEVISCIDRLRKAGFQNKENENRFTIITESLKGNWFIRYSKALGFGAFFIGAVVSGLRDFFIGRRLEKNLATEKQRISVEQTQRAAEAAIAQTAFSQTVTAPRLLKKTEPSKGSLSSGAEVTQAMRGAPPTSPPAAAQNSKAVIAGQLEEANVLLAESEHLGTEATAVRKQAHAAISDLSSSLVDPVIKGQSLETSLQSSPIFLKPASGREKELDPLEPIELQRLTPA